MGINYYNLFFETNMKIFGIRQNLIFNLEEAIKGYHQTAKAIVYGSDMSGILAATVFDFLPQVRFCGFVDGSEERQTKGFLGIPIRDPEETDFSEFDIVIIATAPRHYREITETIDRLGGKTTLKIYLFNERDPNPILPETYHRVVVSCRMRSGSSMFRNFFHKAMEKAHYRYITPENTADETVMFYLKDRTDDFDWNLESGEYCLAHYLLTDRLKSKIKAGHIKGIHTIRDPRDAILSLAHYIKFRNWLPNEENIVDNLIEAYGCQIDDSLKWMTCPKANTLIIKYEDMTRNPSATFKSVCDFLHIPLPDTLIQKYASDVTFERLSGGRSRGQEDRQSHFRKGVSDGWKQGFTPSQLSRIDALYSEKIKRLGY